MIPRRWAHSEPAEYATIRRWMKEEGPEFLNAVAEWENRIAVYVGVPGAAAVNSGRQGLRIVMERLGIGAGDEMIVPAYTLGEMLPFVQSLGVKLVPADIDPCTFNITPGSVEQRITPKTKAVLALHVFGMPCDIEGISALAARHSLLLIEDCAHALGATVKDRKAGSFGDAAFFSFEVTKMINTYGGGIVCARDQAIVEATRAFNGNEPAGYVTLSRKLDSTLLEKWLFRTRLMYLPLFLLASPRLQPLMNKLYRGSQQTQKKRERYMPAQARIGLCKLDTLEERLELRRSRAALLTSLLKPEIRPQQTPDGVLPTWYCYVVLVPGDAARIRQRLLLRGVDAGAGNEIMDNCAAQLGYDDCPRAEAVFSHALALPIYDGISEQACERVAKTLNRLV